MEQTGKTTIWGYLIKNKPLYIMLIPGLLYFLIFKYIPLIGSVIAFQDYNIFAGMANSEWVGLKWFEQFLTFPNFQRILWNTIIISFYQIVFAFPLPIILACLLNELRNLAFKRSIQTIVYLPHFFSWTLVFGFAYMLLSSQTGLLNDLIELFGIENITFLQEKQYFRTIVISAGIWKEMGWSAIIFLAALAGVNPVLYEAATIDGANRWHQFWNVTFPALLPAIMILLLLKIGHVLDLGFEQIYLFLNPATLEVGEIIDTFSYREGVLKSKYSLTTAVGLFKSVIGFIALVVSNRLSRMLTGQSLY